MPTDTHTVCDECHAQVPTEIVIDPDFDDGKHNYEAQYCPRCGTSLDYAARLEDMTVIQGVSDKADASWEEIAAELQSYGVPRERSRVVALVATTHSYSEIADRDDIGVNTRGGVGNYVSDYRQQRRDAEELATYGPEI